MIKKKRTRQHIIADLCVNHVERYLLLCGYSAERVEHDYGFDLVISTYDSNGEIENGYIYAQLKATDSLKLLADRETISFTINCSDLELWLEEPMPSILIVYDAIENVAYWLYLQAYFKNLDKFNLSQVGATVTVNISKKNLFNEKAIAKFAQYKNKVLQQIQGVISHDD